jgi:hypothetical protein
MANGVLYPAGAADVRTITAAQAAAGIPISDTLTILNLSLTANSALVLVPDVAQLRPGSQVIVNVTSDATARTATPGAGFLAATPVITGVISKTVATTYRFNGATFQIEAATATIN